MMMTRANRTPRSAISPLRRFPDPVRRRLRPALALTAGLSCLMLAGLAGCEDSAAQQRTEAQRILDQAATDFLQARVGTVAPDDEQYQAVQTQLNSVVTQLASLNDGEPGQLAAKSLLSSEAHRELAQMRMLEAGQIERELQNERLLLREQVIAALRLGALSTGMSSISSDEIRNEIQQRRQAAQQELESLSQHLAELENPIDERTALNTQEAERVQILRREANDLLREATELGHARGFGRFQEGIEQRREADRIENRIAHRDLDLNLELLPQQNLAEARIEDVRELLGSIDRVLSDLEAFENTYRDEVARLNTRIDELRSEIMSGVSSLAERMNDQLAPAYDASLEQLDRAATQARQAAGRLRGADANAARLAEARSLELQGTLLWQRASGVADQASLLAAIVDADETLGDVSDAQRRLEAANTTQGDLIERSRESLSSASNIVAQLAGRGDQSMDRYRDNLQALLGAMSGDTNNLSSSIDADASQSASGTTSGESPNPAESMPRAR